MTVLRITANIAHDDPAQVAGFYSRVFGLEVAMDMGWIVTLAGPGSGPIQLSAASEGGSGTDVPALSVEVDDLDAVRERASALGHAPDGIRPGCRTMGRPTRLPAGSRGNGSERADAFAGRLRRPPH